PRARPGRDHRDRRGRTHDRGGGRALRGDDRAGGARRRRGRPARGGPDQPHGALHARGPVLAALGRADRAADLAAVVHAHGAAGPGWEQDSDVLDTWFSSALWPFATLGWPDATAELRAFYPTDVLLTARDILFLWVARMVMMGLEFAGDVPFQDVYVHSVVQAP